MFHALAFLYKVHKTNKSTKEIKRNVYYMFILYIYENTYFINMLKDLLENVSINKKYLF